ncbi:hypothetical protein MEX01_23730 [Methylorubrum extorquens]|nr:hypothetical protein MEX01_23730 [Methylorubrum extorquens]
MRRLLMALAGAVLAQSGAAWAQQQPITNVNECTFITDPIALKRCIDGFQLRGPPAQYPQSPPIPPIETPAQAQRDSVGQAVPPNTSYRDSPEWLGSKDKDQGKPEPKRNPRVIDLSK